jgi:uncharacterized damage-inducible protein DinB
MSTQALTDEFIRVSRHELRQRLLRIEYCLEKLTLEQIWSREHEIENSVGNLVLHLCGNIRQWIISGVAGAADNRDRDAEFSRREPMGAGELAKRLRETVEEASEILAELTPGELLGKRKIQVYHLTVLNAVYHVVEHFGEHTGQIMCATKRMLGEDLNFYGYLKDASLASKGNRLP